MVVLFLCPAGLSVLVHILLLGMKNLSAAYIRLFCGILLSFPFLLAHNIALYAESLQVRNEGTFSHQANLYEPQNKNILSFNHTGLNFYSSSKCWHSLLFSVGGMSPPEKRSIPFSQGSHVPHLFLA